MNLIKQSSFQAIDNLQQFIIFNSDSSIKPEIIKRQIINYLVDNGSKKFVELYNQTITNRDILTILNKLEFSNV